VAAKKRFIDQQQGHRRIAIAIRQISPTLSTAAAVA
jgi:hypothetical protein